MFLPGNGHYHVEDEWRRHGALTMHQSWADNNEPADRILSVKLKPAIASFAIDVRKSTFSVCKKQLICL